MLPLVVTCLLVTLGATLSASVGLAGGVIMLLAISLVFDAKTTIPIHTALIFIGYTIRLVVFWRWVEWRFIFWYALMLTPGVYCGVQVLVHIDPVVLEKSRGIAILLSSSILLLHKPKIEKVAMGPSKVLGLSFFAGFLGPTVGSSGPLVASSLLGIGLVNQGFVATLTACQLLLQIVKTIFFVYLLQFDYWGYRYYIALLTGCLLVGTLMGKALVDKINPESFRMWVVALVVFLCLKVILF